MPLPIPFSHLFSQARYVTRHGWDHPDPSKRKGAFQDEIGVDGACLSLAGAYILARGDWGQFNEIIESPIGLATIRGIMNIMLERERVGLLTIDTRQQLFQELMALFKLESTGPSVTGGINDHLGHTVMAELTEGKGYILSLWERHDVGHTVAIIKKNSTFMFMDPAHGALSETNEQTFKQFLTRWWLEMLRGTVRFELLPFELPEHQYYLHFLTQ